MTCLSVNINKIATLRNSRGGDYPNVCNVAKDVQHFGAHGIIPSNNKEGKIINGPWRSKN